MIPVDEFITTPGRADIAARVLAGLAVRGSYCTAADAAEQAIELTDALIERLEAPDHGPPKYPLWMAVCPKCGSKRCPRASNPSNPCEKETP
mgnify:CR=1 FL=1